MSNRGRDLQVHRFATYAWCVLAYNILVILWGAVVRATGSGAGCGEHWPLCQGVVIPHAAQIATGIEFAHRASSGVAVALVLGLAFLGFRRFDSGHPVRRYAIATVLFTFTEGLIGAALVLAGLVGKQASMTRALVLSVHLVNTLLLLASLALCASSAAATGIASGSSGFRESSTYTPHSRAWYIVGLLGVVAIAISGTIAALGDTLFHATSLAQGFSWDMSGSSNALLRLRIIHPVIAVVFGAFLVVVAVGAVRSDAPAQARRMAKYLLVLICVQLALGLLNLLLLTPLWTQILHLLVADLIWLSMVLLSAEMLLRAGAPVDSSEGTGIRELAAHPVTGSAPASHSR